MALELNNKKYLVLCVMLISLNHHINGANGAHAATGSKPQAPANGSTAAAPHSGTPELQVPKYATKDEPWVMSNGKLISSNKPKSINVDGIGTPAGGQPQVPCYFIFGDSLVDAGNNNNLITLAKANYKPYGIDFKPVGATGRFSNGKTTIDFTSEILGFDHYIPPSEQTNGKDMLQGLNFASAAAGIRDDTAHHLGDRISMSRQVESFKTKVGEMAGLLGGPKNTTAYLGKCLYQVGLGSNDYLNNYFVPSIYPTSKQLTPEQFADDLIKQYTTHLMVIYNLGARKIALTGVSQVGCSPNALARNSQDGTCIKSFNDANEMFNTRLRTLTDTLNKQHPDAKFTYVNSFGIFQDLKDKAATLGFKNTNSGCCGVGKYHGQITCLPGLTTCRNRTEYLFWDAYHPTEATNKIVSRRAYIKESPTDAYPYDIHTLLTLK
ncbi:GDSL-lipase 1 [Heracleum sosnowskyi]|uniref:GDSL-lipase 1 n=1 Tax=Heracleum sosnowskyi TaxID=360622 RepID=A0AAD8MDM5_9APIA|nr:GDSL-lipase 1 [Heracleum sosnowskyi]